MNSIVLASASPRRRELLEQAGIPFEVVPGDADENMEVREPEHFVKLLSERKAQEVADRLDGSRIVLGADTVVVLKDEIMGKPVDEADAERMLQKLQGNIHHVYTGVTLILPDGRVVSHAEKTAVHMHPMTKEEIRAYIATGESMDKAGGYGIQGRSAIYIEGITGDYNNVVGLPLARVYQMLKKYSQV